MESEINDVVEGHLNLSRGERLSEAMILSFQIEICMEKEEKGKHITTSEHIKMKSEIVEKRIT
jgi:hypothetical protein